MSIPTKRNAIPSRGFGIYVYSSEYGLWTEEYHRVSEYLEYGESILDRVADLFAVIIQ